MITRLMMNDRLSFEIKIFIDFYSGKPQERDEKMEIIRQGDVILRKISDSTNIESLEYKTSKLSDTMVISGETGHMHILEAPVYAPVYGYKIYHYDGGVEQNPEYVVVQHPTELKHEEHNHIIVDPGIYEISSVRDYIRNNNRD